MNFGNLLLAIYLIVVGLTTLLAMPLPAWLMGILALIAGVLILVGR